MALNNRRVAERKSVDSIYVTELTALSSYTELVSEATIMDASISGLLLSVQRTQLVPKDLRENLTLESLVGQQVIMFLPQMNLDLDGRITRADHMGRGEFEVAIEFSHDVPEYWRECLIDLLPAPGEMERDET